LINIHYHKGGKLLLFGVATDDSHRYHTFSSKYSNTGREWVMVNAKKDNPIIEDETKKAWTQPFLL